MQINSKEITGGRQLYIMQANMQSNTIKSNFKMLKQLALGSKIFRGASVPMLTIEGQSGKINMMNEAAALLLNPERQNPEHLDFIDFMPGSDVIRLKQHSSLILAGHPGCRVEGVVLRSAEGRSLHFDLFLAGCRDISPASVLLMLLPGSSPQPSAASPALPAGNKLEELVYDLSRQLRHEHIVTNITSALSSTFDRDIILQTALDSAAKALGAQKALVVKTDGPASPMVSHEYALPDIAPLGLGRTSQFPAGAVNLLKSGSATFPDLTSPESRLSQSDIHQLLEAGVMSMAGCPIEHHGQYHGHILVVESEKPKQWSAQELNLLEAIAQQTSVALNRAGAYAELKDQLFNMNLISNLAQQLTNVLDLATRARPDAVAENIRPPAAAHPLSARELEVLKLIASGLSNRAVAQRLFLTESTVELHASRIRKKLKLNSRTALVKYACDNHLV